MTKSLIKLVKSLDNGILYYRGKVYVSNSDLWCYISALCHDSRIAGHAGMWKTLELVSRNYWWPQMLRYIGRYVSTCDMCLCTKVSCQPPVREPHLLCIRNAPWDTISVDSTVELPESEEKDVIMMVVDSITKHGHFIDTVTMLSAAGTARLYVQHIWKHHGLPKKVVSDRCPQFVAEFMKELYQHLGIKLAATTTYHPQGDGQIERINQELEQYLWLFINQRQDNWVRLLSFAEFQYNNHVHSATQQSSFILDTRQVPCIGFKPGQRRSHLKSVNKFKEHVEDVLEEAKAALAKSNDNMAKYYDWRWTPTPDYKPRDKVYLDGDEDAWLLPSEIALITLVYSSFKLIRAAAIIHSSYSSYIAIASSRQRTTKACSISTLWLQQE